MTSFKTAGFPERLENQEEFNAFMDKLGAEDEIPYDIEALCEFLDKSDAYYVVECDNYAIVVTEVYLSVEDR